MTIEHRRQAHKAAAAAGRRIPDRERAGVGGSRHRHRHAMRRGVRRARAARGREGPARTGRREEWRGDLRRLRAQAGRAGQGPDRAAALREAQAGRRVRRRRRPRCRQAPGDGRDRREGRRHRHRHRRQSAQRESRRHSCGDHCAPRPAHARSAIAPRRFAWRSPSCSRATRW